MKPDEAIELLKNMKWSITTKFNAVNNSTKALDLAISALKKQEKDRWSKYRPISAQPERPKGRWIPVDSYSAFGGDEATWMAHGNPVAFYYCSECKEQAYAGEDGESLITDYCPNCGAKMDCERKE